jgi:tRNA A-37 threonylcarbamoyl transferase component Bud32
VSRTPAPATAPPDLPGYRFIRHLGAGGNAQVYLYEQDLPRREVAVKVLNDSTLSEAARRRFTAEANVTAGLPHRHIVQVFDAKVTDDGRPYIVMPYYPQPNLSVRARRSHFSVAEVLRIGIQIGSAVETSHRHDVLHRDIKPQNILTDSYGEPALTDFGIATTKGGDGPEGLSVPWSPAEILYGSAPGDQRSDVYSLGATLWHLLAGRSPFEQPGGDNSPYALMGRIKSDPVPRTGRADVPDSLERLLRQAMAKDPAARPQTAMALIRGLQSIEQELRLPVTQPILPADGQPAADAAGDTVTRAPASSGEATFSRGYERDRGPGRGGTRAPGNWTDSWRPGAAAQPPWGHTAEPAWGADPRTHAGAAPHSEGWAGDTHDMTVARGLTGAVDDDATRARAPRRLDPWPTAGTAPGDTDNRTRARGPARPDSWRGTEEDETRARAPMRLDPWGGAAVPSSEGRVREFPPQPPDAATVARPRSLAPDTGAGAAGGQWWGEDRRPGQSGEPGESGQHGQPGQHRPSGQHGQHGRPGRGGRALALAAGGAVLAVVAVVAVLVLGHHGPQLSGTSAGSGQATSSGGAQDAVGLGATAPGTPTVTAHRVSATEVQFSWTYANPAPHDTFLWRRVEGTAGAAKGTTATAGLRVHLVSEQTLCIQVEVVRTDGEVSGAADACAGN